MDDDHHTMNGDGASCVPNIGVRERRKRMASAVVGLAIGACLGVVLIAYGASRLSRLWLFLPLWIGALGYFQAREKT